ncbi:hypothetical protein ACMAZF_01290 [Psychrobium sp. nBUS_13]|uniref:hypothetical protein n=1 Tax=Psychrobium sp. nBUS_13 TaxID=3395319 RepID=UPI003EC1084F
MAMQPINPNESLDAEHCLYAGTTGAGKSVATQKMKRIKPTDQVVFWDFYGQYKGKKFLGREVRTYDTLKSFFNALYAGRKTNQGFKIAFTPKNAPEGKRPKRELFLKFCQVLWSAGNGTHKKKLHCVMEEINRVTITTGDEDSIYGELLEVGRKFGFVIHSVSQRLAPIPNTVISMSGYKWVGVQEAEGDVSRISRELGVSIDEIKSLKKLEYFFKLPGFGNVERGKLRF